MLHPYDCWFPYPQFSLFPPLLHKCWSLPSTTRLVSDHCLLLRSQVFQGCDEPRSSFTTTHAMGNTALLWPLNGNSFSELVRKSTAAFLSFQDDGLPCSKAIHRSIYLCVLSFSICLSTDLVTVTVTYLTSIHSMQLHLELRRRDGRIWILIN